MKTYIKYNNRFFELFVSSGLGLKPFWAEAKGAGCAYLPEEHKLLNSAIKHICSYEGINANDLELITE